MKSMLYRTLCFIFIIVLNAAFILNSCVRPESPNDNPSNTTSKEPSDDTIGNIAKGKQYSYSFITEGAIENDSNFTMLTDGSKDDYVQISMHQITASVVNWSSENQTINAFENPNDAYYHITVDLGFISEVTSINLHFANGENYVLPSNIELFSSDDGYNFTKYINVTPSISDSEANFDLSSSPLNAKAVRFYIYTPIDTTNAISEVEINGTQQHKITLLSGNASYEWEGRERSGCSDDGTKLTDGLLAPESSKENIVAKWPASTDNITNKKCSQIVVDLGAVKNVSEVCGNVLTRIGLSSAVPELMSVRYSKDGNEYTDFGQSYPTTFVGTSSNARYRYTVTRNHTVKARYLLLTFYTETLILIDEIAVYGSDTEVSEPSYSFAEKQLYSNTNVAAYREVLLNGKAEADLTDMYSSPSSSFVTGSNKNTFEFDATEISQPITGVRVVLAKNTLKSANVYYKNESDEYIPIDADVHTNTVASSTNIDLYFDSVITESTIKVEIETKDNAKIREFQAFASQQQAPIMRGGFFQLPTNGGTSPSALNSPYSWYLQLKGMKELGMEYVVIQYGAHFFAKTTLINGDNIKSLGFTYNATYGSTDVPMAVLDAAEKLGMKVFIGTIHDSNFQNISEGKKTYDAIIEAGQAIIKDINEKYGDHTAFAGFYLSDETCDLWLNMGGGVEAARKVYKSQSDLIHSIAPDKKVMIAPAIWRSGPPERSANNLYSVLAADTDGGRPVADIVAVQDCLGREESILVSDETYDSFESYLEKWAEAIRMAGAEFWNDTEVFDVNYSSKSTPEIIRSLSLEARYSNISIVFDIPHYFTTLQMYSVTSWKHFNLTDVTMKYVKFYSELSDDLTFVGEDPKKDIILPEKQDGEDIINNDHLITYETTPNKITKIQTKLDSLLEGNIDFVKFAKHDTEFVPEYRLFWDSENLYLLIKPNDNSASYGNGLWWEGKDDLIQIWITADGSIQSNSALDSDYGLRYYAHRVAAEEWACGYSTSDGINTADLPAEIYKQKDDFVVFKFTWNSFQRNAPKANDKTAIGFKVQYIDGDTEKWSSSLGDSSQKITSNEIYGFSN